jgi:hypothetical protein
MAKRIKVGELTNEGIYIGRFEDKSGVKKDYFAAPTDAQDESGKRLSLSFNQAAQYAKNLTALGHNDWVVPTGYDDKNGAPDILKALYNNSSKGAFTDTFLKALDVDSHYWSSTTVDGFMKTNDFAKLQNFSVNYLIEDFGSGSLGRPSTALKSNQYFVRPVRSVAV